MKIKTTPDLMRDIRARIRQIDEQTAAGEREKRLLRAGLDAIQGKPTAAPNGTTRRRRRKPGPKPGAKRKAVKS